MMDDGGGFLGPIVAARNLLERRKRNARACKERAANSAALSCHWRCTAEVGQCGFSKAVAGSEHQEPTEEHHRDDCRCHGTCHSNDAEQHQCNTERQEPPPVLDNLVRNLDVQVLDIAHRHFLSLSFQKACLLGATNRHAPLHSITSSVTASSDDGTVMPSIRAVAALITNSSLLD